MRYSSFFFAFIAASVFLSCNNASQPDKQDSSEVETYIPPMQTAVEGDPAITFEKQLHDFGKVTLGEVLEYSFKLTNTGGSDLIIYKAEASCGCTVPEWPKEPIRPGQSAYMKVVFDSKGRPEGFTEKSIMLTANTNPPMINGPSIVCTIVKK
jgi:hypothetical protein